MTDTSSPSLAAKLRTTRSELLMTEVEAVALELFEVRGFDDVTVDEIAAAAQISVRTFYRYFPAKEDVLQVQIDRRNAAVAAALERAPSDATPLGALRLALGEAITAEDAELRRRWVSIVASNPSVMNSVLGGIVLKGHQTFARYLGERLDQPQGALLPAMLAGAVGGVVQAATTNWLLDDGDLAAMVSEGLAVLERGVAGDPKAWRTTRPSRTRPTKAVP